MIKRIFILVTLLILVPGSVGAQQTPAQKKVFDSGINHFEVEADCRTSSSIVSPNATGTSVEQTQMGIQKVNPAPFQGAPITPTGIVLHWTGGSPNQSVESFISGISGRNLSVQLYIDGTGNVYQLVDQLNTLTSHAAGANSKTIGIEIAAGSDGTVETAAAEINANIAQKQAVVRTVVYIIETFNLQIDPDVAGLKGILSHHLLSPNIKSDVGDQYHQDIINAVRNGGQLVLNNNGPCQPSAGGGGLGGDAESNKLLGQDLAADRGFVGEEWTCLLELWTRESSWNHEADNPDSSAYGIPQALMGVHKANIDANYQGYYEREIQETPGEPSTYNYTGGSPEAQIKWGLDYIEGRYQTPCRALAFHDANGYY